MSERIVRYKLECPECNEIITKEWCRSEDVAELEHERNCWKSEAELNAQCIEELKAENKKLYLAVQLVAQCADDSPAMHSARQLCIKLKKDIDNS